MLTRACQMIKKTLNKLLLHEYPSISLCFSGGKKSTFEVVCVALVMEGHSVVHQLLSCIPFSQRVFTQGQSYDQKTNRAGHTMHKHQVKSLQFHQHWF